VKPFGGTHSLAARVVFVQCLAIVLAAVVLPLIGVWVLHHTARGEQRRVLADQAEIIAGGLYRGPDKDEWLVKLPGHFAEIYDNRYDGRAFIVLDRQLGPVMGSLYSAGLPWEHVPLGVRSEAFTLAPFVGVSVPITRGDRKLWIIVVQDETGPGVIVGGVVAQSLVRFAAVFLPILLLLALASGLIVRRLVVTVRRVSEASTLIGPRSLHIRLPEEGMPSEVAPLIHATNELVARLEESFHSQAQFVANVVHELRTPLSALRMRLDGVTDPAVRAPLDAQIERLSHVISQLHDLASLEELATGATAEFDLAVLAAEVVAEWAPQVFEGAHVIALEAPDVPVPVGGNRVLAGLAVANLVSNALRHTPAGTFIVVRVGEDARLDVEDDGPGVTQFEPEHLTRRFWRADHRRSDNAGLGLAIVRRIMEMHDGQIEIGGGRSGGARFSLLFPVAGTQALFPAAE
jgi:signal transduction histidine kinase